MRPTGRQSALSFIGLRSIAPENTVHIKMGKASHELRSPLSAMQSYNEGQFVLDPFVNLPPGEVISLHEYLSSEALLASDFYRIIMEPQGWYDFLGLDLREEGDTIVAASGGRGGRGNGPRARERRPVARCGHRGRVSADSNGILRGQWRARAARSVFAQGR